MKITSVEKNKKNRNRVSVFIEGRYGFSISEEDFLCLNLYEKKEITPEEMDYVNNEILFREAKALAVKYLALRLRSEGELRIKLRQEDYSHELIESVIEEVRSLGYINDKLYAQKYVYDRSKLKPKSKKMLKLELKAKGIPDEIADEALDDLKVDDASVAEGLVKKKFGKYDLSDEKIVKRIYSFLHHRGFRPEIIEGIVEKIKNEPV